MIDESKVDKQHMQMGNSCVLSSKVIVANYFTGQPIQDFLKLIAVISILNMMMSLNPQRRFMTRSFTNI